MKEEVDFDPSKTEQLATYLNMNDKKFSKKGMEFLEYTFKGYVPWIVDEVEEKISTALGMDQLTSFYILFSTCKAVVLNEFIDILTC